MIFAKTIDLVLSGRKTQTLRLAYPGDELRDVRRLIERVPTDTRAVVNDRWGMDRWVVGRTYAVQPERCHHARGRILVTSLAEVLDPLGVDDDFARREGFDTFGAYAQVWRELHPRNPVQRCWAIGFELVSPRKEA